MADSPQLPRPWFISLALLWSDDVCGMYELGRAIEYAQKEAPLEKRLIIPPNHTWIPELVWHSTAFAVVEINHQPNEDSPQREFAREIFKQVATLPRLRKLAKAWTKAFPNGLQLEAFSVWVHDDGTVVQFRQKQQSETHRFNSPLEHFRDTSYRLLSRRVSTLVGSYPATKLKQLIRHPYKSAGSRVYGSIARSPCRSDRADLRYAVEIKPSVDFTFTHAHLVVSDEALTNPRTLAEDEYLIP